MRWVRVVVVAITIASVMSGSARVAPAAPPNEASADGPCGSERHRFHNPVMGAPRAYVFLPTGAEAAPVGGECGDAARPVVLFAHGYSAMIPEVYAGLIEHLVSAGYAVVYPAYQLTYNPTRQYRQVEVGFETAVAKFERLDMSRLGILGHSFGAGMSPWLTQWATAHGWGTDAIWLVAMMPHFSLNTGSGAIDIPDHTRAAVIAGQKD
ncbi:MAG: hypothetical protein IT198_13235, partial [Acidimicrobiia bacterium]|nr:hypothetical protein [Acidimicrobiia bacterium]